MATTPGSDRHWKTPVPEITEGLVLRRDVDFDKHVRVVGAALQQNKLEAAREKLAKWEKKLSYAKNKVRKYTREIRRREKLVAQGGA